jgi:anti-sigma regulatory factor (Ser/Thr protein kinase)
MTVQRSQIRIYARTEEVGRACEFVAQMAAQAGLDAKARHHCHLAIDEACTNIIEHAYSGGGPDDVIDVWCHQSADSFDMVVVDDGPPFDPLQLPAPDPGRKLDDRHTGGWGVYFIRKFMDKVDYEYRDGRNHLYMAKMLPRPIS